MSTNKKIFLSLFALLLASFATNVSYANSVTYGVDFGIRMEGGGDCVGKGVCDCQSVGTGTSVSFSVSEENSNVMVMTFSLSELKANQPAQIANFTDASGTYNFQTAFSLTASLFSSLNLPSGAALLPSGNSTVVINGDVCTVYYTMNFGS